MYKRDYKLRTDSNTYFRLIVCVLLTVFVGFHSPAQGQDWCANDAQTFTNIFYRSNTSVPADTLKDRKVTHNFTDFYYRGKTNSKKEKKASKKAAKAERNSTRIEVMNKDVAAQAADTLAVTQTDTLYVLDQVEADTSAIDSIQQVTTAPDVTVSPVLTHPIDTATYKRSLRTKHCYKTLAIKTNLAMDAATAFNLELEFSMGRHFSLDLPVYYNPVRFSRQYTLRTLAAQPELRYWTCRPMDGHFFGIHALAGYYNLYLSNGWRYQDLDGETPCYGGGLSYGYVALLNRHLSLEFTVGVGAVYFKYDRFHNTINGQLYDRKQLWYVGPTRVGITISYNFNRK